MVVVRFRPGPGSPREDFFFPPTPSHSISLFHLFSRTPSQPNNGPTPRSPETLDLVSIVGSGHIAICRCPSGNRSVPLRHTSSHSYGTLYFLRPAQAFACPLALTQSIGTGVGASRLLRPQRLRGCLPLPRCGVEIAICPRNCIRRTVDLAALSIMNSASITPR